MKEWQTPWWGKGRPHSRRCLKRGYQQGASSLPCRPLALRNLKCHVLLEAVPDIRSDIWRMRAGQWRVGAGQQEICIWSIRPVGKVTLYTEVAAPHPAPAMKEMVYRY